MSSSVLAYRVKIEDFFELFIIINRALPARKRQVGLYVASPRSCLAVGFSLLSLTQCQSHIVTHVLRRKFISLLNL